MKNQACTESLYTCVQRWGEESKKGRPRKKREPCNRPKKYKKWSEESMTGAMKAVADGLFGVNKAADEFGVPRSTLKDRLSGKVAHGARSGPTPYLSGVEEDELVKFLLTSTDIGLPKTRVEVIDIVRKAVIKKRGTDKGFNGEGWWHRFLERHPELSLHKGDALALSRAAAITGNSMKQYYSLLKATLEEHSILDCPHTFKELVFIVAHLENSLSHIGKQGTNNYSCVC